MRANGLNYRTTFLAFPSPPRSFLPFKPSAFLCKIGLAEFDQIWTNEYDFIAKAFSVPAGRFLHFQGLMFRDQKKPSLFLSKEVAAFSISRTERNQQKRGETNVLTVFRDYLRQDPEEEVLPCRRGYVRISWNRDTKRLWVFENRQKLKCVTQL